MADKLFDLTPVPCIVASSAGAVIEANRAALLRFNLDPGATLPDLSDLFKDATPRFRDDLLMAAGSSGWQTSVAEIKTGELAGLRQHLRLRGVRLDTGADNGNPAVMICFREAGENAFAEHTRLIRRLNSQIAAQKSLQSQLERMVEKEEYLHQELVHRVKNNLAVLSGIIRAKARSVSGDEAREALRAIELRTSSIALVHGLLDRANSIDVIEAHDLIVELCELMRQSLMPPGVKLVCNVDSLRLHNEDAAALCLLINELVTNSLKHAFEDAQQGLITLDFRQNGVDKMELSVRDDGKGSDVPAGGVEGSHGTRILYALAEQLNGSLSHRGEQGTEWTLIFNPRETTDLAAQ